MMNSGVILIIAFFSVASGGLLRFFRPIIDSRVGVSHSNRPFVSLVSPTAARHQVISSQTTPQILFALLPSNSVIQRQISSQQTPLAYSYLLPTSSSVDSLQSLSSVSSLNSCPSSMSRQDVFQPSSTSLTNSFANHPFMIPSVPGSIPVFPAGNQETSPYLFESLLTSESGLLPPRASSSTYDEKKKTSKHKHQGIESAVTSTSVEDTIQASNR